MKRLVGDPHLPLRVQFQGGRSQVEPIRQFRKSSDYMIRRARPQTKSKEKDLAKKSFRITQG